MIRMHSVVKWLAAPLAVMLFVATVSDAQEQQRERGQRGQRGGRGPGFIGRGPGGPGGGGIMGLLQNDVVVKELKLSEDQRGKFRDIGESTREKMGNLFSGLREASPDERRAMFEEIRPKMQKLQEDAEERAKGILSQDQYDRLLGILIQQQGAQALRNPDVAERVGLNDEDQAIVNGALDSVREKMGEIFRAAREGGGGFDGIREKMTEVREEAEKEALAVLTEEQRKKFDDLKGAKIDLPQRQFGRGPGGRGPGGRGGEGGRGRGGEGGRPRRPSTDE